MCHTTVMRGGLTIGGCVEQAIVFATVHGTGKFNFNQFMINSK